MSISKELRYRAVCPICKKAFDIRTGKLYFGHLTCEDCYKKVEFKYKTIDDYIKEK